MEGLDATERSPSPNGKGKISASLRAAAELNLAQWVSALSTTVVAFITIYALFFSEASSALIKYLHSELSVRNLRIAELAKKEHELQLAVQRRESELSELTAQAEKIRSTLSLTEFSLVKEKIGARLSSTIVVTWPLNLSDEWLSPQGIKPRTVEFWTDYLKFIRGVADKLPAHEKKMGDLVVQRFVEQCGHLSKVTVRIPALRSALAEIKSTIGMSPDDRKKHDEDWQRRDKDFTQKYERLSEQLSNSREQIRKCFADVKQPENPN